MKVAVAAREPELTSRIEPRFGQAAFIIVLDTDTGQFVAHDNAVNRSAVREAGRRAARTVLRLGVDAVVAATVSAEALAMLRAGNIEVHIAPSGSVVDSVEEFEATQCEQGRDRRSEMYYWT